jgi:hypothetical protein
LERTCIERGDVVLQLAQLIDVLFGQQIDTNTQRLSRL